MPGISSSKRMQRNREALIALHRIPPNLQRKMLGSLKTDTIQSLVEAAINIMRGNVPLTESQFNNLKRFRKELTNFTKKKTSQKQRLAMLQKGNGLLSGLLGPIAQMLGGLFTGNK